MFDALMVITPGGAGTQPWEQLHPVIDGMGSVSFWPRLMNFLESVAGGEHYVVWELRNGSMQQVGAASWNGEDQAQRRLIQYADPKFWRRDPALSVAQKKTPGMESSILVRMDPRRVSDTLIRETLYGEDHIRERVVLCKKNPQAMFGLSVVRTENRGPFSDSQLNTLTAVADTLLSLLGKHHQIITARHAYNPVSDESLPDIEWSLKQSRSGLTQREAQVCARLICGHLMSAIATELGLSPETVETYRKRAYERLGVTSKQAQLLRYMGYH